MANTESSEHWETLRLCLLRAELRWKNTESIHVWKWSRIYLFTCNPASPSALVLGPPSLRGGGPANRVLLPPGRLSDSACKPIPQQAHFALLLLLFLP